MYTNSRVALSSLNFYLNNFYDVNKATKPLCIQYKYGEAEKSPVKIPF